MDDNIDSLPEPGTRVQYEEIPDPLSTQGPVEQQGTIVETEVETTWLNVDEKVESEVARIELDSGDTRALNPDQIGAEISEGETGRVARVIGPRRSADSPLFDVPVAPQATDIGRRASGRFDRTHREPEISTEPIARDQQTGRFQVDPFDLTPGYEGAPTDGFENPFGDSSRRSGSSHHEEESSHGRY